MSAANNFEQELLEHIFQNANIANIGDATGLRGSSAAGSLYLSLHTADPGEAGDQQTNEATYTSYARVAVARNGTEWDVTANVATMQNAATFPKCTGGSNTITHWGIGTSVSGAGKLLFKGALSASIAVATNVTPEITTLTVTVD